MTSKQERKLTCWMSYSQVICLGTEGETFWASLRTGALGSEEEEHRVSLFSLFASSPVCCALHEVTGAASLE